MFRGKFLALLAVAFRRKKLRLAGQLQPLQRPETFDRLLRSLKKPNWVVEVRAPFGGPEHVLKYLARYTHRVAISNGRLLELRDGQVTFRWRDSADHNTQKGMTLEAVEFIRRFLLHVLPPGFVKIRHFGFLANSCRAKALKLCRTLLRASPRPDPLGIRQRNAIERKYPCCGIGTLCLLGYVPASLINSSPHPRLTYKVNGKTVTESFATAAGQRKTEREIETFRRYRQLERSFVEINERICRARPVEDTMTLPEKKRPKRSRRKSRAK